MADAMELIRYGNIGGGVSSLGVQIWIFSLKMNGFQKKIF